MAINQTSISKKPRMGAIILLPRDMNTIRRVSMVTSTILVAKIKKGSITYKNKVESRKAESNIEKNLLNSQAKLKRYSAILN